MTNARRERPVSEVAAQLRDLGVAPGQILVIHTSFRAVGPIEGGPQGLIEALGRAVGADGTLVMPSWTGDDDEPFDPATTEPSPDLGVLPATFWRLPAVRRASHPFAFAARGPSAAEILADPLVLPPYQLMSPLGRVLELDGRILLLGVDHDANTNLHLAECLADVPYGVPKYITVMRDGAPRRLDYRENDHCCQRFRLANDWLRPDGLQREGPVGHGSAKLMRARDLVDAALARLRDDPLVFLCPQDSGCEECVSARRSLS